jgi:hypothetical protein
MAKGNYIATIEHRVAGIPCIIGVIDYTCVRGSYSYNAASDWDYHGYTDSEWELLDRNGRRAAWLDYKLNDDEETSVEEAIAEYMSESADAYDDY